MKRHPKYLLLAVILTLFQVFSSGCSSDSDENTPAIPAATVVTEWNTLTLHVLMEDAVPNQFGSRALAMVHTAMFDAINAIGNRYQPYHLDLGPLATSGTSKAAAGATAAHRILTTLYPARAAAFDDLLATQLAVIPEGTGKAAGIVLGRVAADEILLLRSNDGSAVAATVPFPDGTEPGQWRRTDTRPPQIPGWGAVKPWAMTSGQQFRAAGPPPLVSAEYAAAYQEVAAIGAIASTTRSQEQTLIARFWMAGIPDHLFAIARQMADEKALDIDDNARFFALLSIALADASICGWDMKYHFGYWRPVTAIHDGEIDGNPDTVGDPAWNALLTAPPFPEYVSGHSTTTAAGMGLLIRFHGSENFSFARTSQTPGLVEPRSFSNLWSMAEEVGISRVYGGIHFSFSNQQGLTAGRQLGEFVFDNFLVAK
jgi:hypothetical protein